MKTYDLVAGFMERIKEDLSVLLPKIVQKMENYMGIRLNQEDVMNAFMIQFEDTAHVLIHELAHVVIQKGLPWTEKLNEFEHTFVDEVLARFIERFISSKLKDEFKLKELKIVVEGFEKQVEELKSYPQLRNIKISVEDYSLLYKDFQKRMDEKGSLEGFGKKLLEMAQSAASR